ncbi:MAG: hypothetical protein Q4C34_02425 [Bacteroidales bacterium]|nr:hypothetical protein [Bacteroidales bacterium]
MKKLLLSVACAVMSMTAMAATWCMPGTYQGWVLEKNLFEEVDGKLTQTIPDLYGDFKIVCYDGNASWDNQWGKTGSAMVENGVAYTMTKGADNVMLAGDNAHYINAKVTITPDGDNLTILVEAERVEAGDEVWQLVGSDPLVWNFTDAPAFEKGDNGVWTLAYEGTISGEFKVAKNATWANCYSTKSGIEIDKEYTLEGPADPIDNMSVIGDAWVNPIFTLTVGDVVKFKVTLANGIGSIEADDTTPAVYYNLQGVEVADPQSGLYIMKRGGKATKVIL